MNQGDWVYAWNYKQPDKKVRTRFLHRLDGIKPSNICTSPDTTDTYPKKVNLRRYDMVVPVTNIPEEIEINGEKYVRVYNHCIQK